MHMPNILRIWTKGCRFLSVPGALLLWCGLSGADEKVPIFEQDFEVDLETLALSDTWTLPRGDTEAALESDGELGSQVLAIMRNEFGKGYATASVPVRPGVRYAVEALANGDDARTGDWTGSEVVPGNWDVFGDHPDFSPVAAGSGVAVQMAWRGPQTKTARAVYAGEHLPNVRDGRVRALVYLMQHGAASDHFAAGLLLRQQSEAGDGALPPENYFVYLSGAGELRIAKDAGGSWNSRGETLARTRLPVAARNDRSRPYLLEVELDGDWIGVRVLESERFGARGFGALARTEDFHDGFTEEVARLGVRDGAYREGKIGVAGYSSGGNKTARFLSIRATPTDSESAAELVPRRRGAVLSAAFVNADGEPIGVAAAEGGRGTGEGWEERGFTMPEPAPPGAEELRVRLGLEGKGAARFDSLRVYQLQEEMRGFSPADGEVVALARPELSWEADFRRYRVELSRNPRFPGAETESVYVGESSARPERALKPGTWHWRVRPWRPGRTGFQGSASDVQSFNVAEDPASWPPAVESRGHWWAAGPRREFEVVVSPFDPAFAVEVEVADKAAEFVRREGERLVFRPGEDLGPGLHSLTVTVRNAAGDSVVEEDFLNNAEPGAISRIGAGKLMEINGEPFFPIASYRDPSGEKMILEGAAEAGWNLMFSYYTAQNRERTRAYLERAHELGIGVMLRFPGGWGYTWDEHMKRTARWVAEFAQHPAVYAWYLGDEPELYGFTPECVRRLERLVEKTDPNTVTTMVSHFPGRHGRPGDVFMPMSYILGPFFDHKWEEPLDSRAILRMNYKYGQGIARIREVWGPPMDTERPIWAILQGFDPRHRDFRKDYEAAVEKHGPRDRPTYKETRNMAFAALAADVQGLFWWWHSSPNLLEQSPSVWKGVVRVSHELKELEPFLEAPASGRDAFDAPDPLMAWTREANGKRVMALVNPVVEGMEAAVDLSKFGVGEVIDRGTGTPVSLKDGRFTASWGAHEVKVLEWAAREPGE